ncbi:SDR family NAD(P)-dependent oxidoreductase [Blastococcus sp. SYSU DS0973]
MTSSPQPTRPPRGAALVTGGGAGIGLDVALHLAGKGYPVAVNDVDATRTGEVVESIRRRGGTATPHPCDVSSEDEVESMVREIVEMHGSLTTLVAAAGISDTVTPTLEQSVDVWQRTVDVDLRGVFLSCKYAGAAMKEAGGGNIVAIASIAGMGGFPKRSGYGPAKAAVINFTQLLAVELAPSGIRVNSVAPGYIKTAMVQQLIDAGRIDEEALAARCPAGHLGQPSHITHAIDYLISEGAAYTTGSTLVVDGGWSAWLGGYT